jgi:hypothetical protein
VAHRAFIKELRASEVAPAGQPFRSISRRPCGWDTTSNTDTRIGSFTGLYRARRLFFRHAHSERASIYRRSRGLQLMRHLNAAGKTCPTLETFCSLTSLLNVDTCYG